MSKHYNTNITEQTRDLLRTKEGDSIKDEVMDIISPVMPIYEEMNTFYSVNETFTLPTDKDFYLCFYQLDCSTDNATIGDNFVVFTTYNNQSLVISNTLNDISQKAIDTHEFIRPIKLKRGSSVAITLSAPGFRLAIGGFFRK
jgi:hypothetical protein